jgi:hypothetical protein
MITIIQVAMTTELELTAVLTDAPSAVCGRRARSPISTARLPFPQLAIFEAPDGNQFVLSSGCALDSPRQG